MQAPKAGRRRWAPVWLAIITSFFSITALSASGTSIDSLPRHALVIGNSDYRALPLANPVNDARSMVETLDKLGFRVTKVENSSQRGMHEAIRIFGDALKDGGIGLFYYAGHGAQIKGRNYLLPVDTVIEREDEVAYKAIDAQQVLDKMGTANNALNIVILDACRNNPFSRSSRSASTGLAPMEAPVGTIVAFATAPGAEASDGSGKHGLYTQQLLHHMTQPGLKVEDVFKRVRLSVRQATSGKQIPWENTSLEGDFYFVQPTPGAVTAGAVTAASSQAAVELEFWNAIKDSDQPPLYQAYLQKFPDGQFVEAARSRAVVVSKDTKPEPTPRQNAARDQARGASSFSFSAEEEKMHAAALNVPPTMPCALDKKNARIRLNIAELELNRPNDSKTGGALSDALAQRLQKAGFRVSREGNADYQLRGTTTTQASVNRILALNEISVNTALTLSKNSGQVVSSVLSREESYAANDLTGAYFNVIQQQADRVVGELYSDLCKGL